MMPRRVVGSPCLRAVVSLMVLLLAPAPYGAFARQEKTPGSRNVTVAGKVSAAQLASSRAGGGGNADRLHATGDLVVEQSLSRPYAYIVTHGHPSGIAAVDISSPSTPRVVSRYAFSGDCAGPGITDLSYFEANDRVLLTAGVQCGESGTADGIILLDVTDVARSNDFAERTRLAVPGGVQHLFAYRHSNGGTLVFAAGGGALSVFDGSELLRGNARPLSEISVPEDVSNAPGGFYAMVAAYQAETETDRLYASGAGGYYVYDVSDPRAPALLTTISSAAVQTGHAIAPTPDGTHVITTAGYRTSPVRIFDLRPALDGTVPRVRTAVGAWTADWRDYAENVLVRWPFVFVAALEDGLQVVNMMNPLEPYTDAYYHTVPEDAPRMNGPSDGYGAWEVDVRNEDGLILLSDTATGLWLFTVQGFQGWDGRGWGLPNISTAQDWKNGPVHATEWPTGEGER